MVVDCIKIAVSVNKAWYTPINWWRFISWFCIVYVSICSIVLVPI